VTSVALELCHNLHECESRAMQTNDVGGTGNNYTRHKETFTSYVSLFFPQLELANGNYFGHFHTVPSSHSVSSLVIIAL